MRGRPERTDCPSCGAVSQWVVEEDGTVVVHGRAADSDPRGSLGVCPSCGADGLVFSMPDGTTARFHGGAVVVLTA